MRILFYLTECENGETSPCDSCKQRRDKERMPTAIKRRSYQKLKIKNSTINIYRQGNRVHIGSVLQDRDSKVYWNEATVTIDTFAHDTF